MPGQESIMIKLPRKIRNIKQIEKWERLWQSSENADYSIPKNLSVDEIREYFSFFMKRLPDDLASSILSDLAEWDTTPRDLIEELFKKGDTSCMVSICCRRDLSDNLLRSCLGSSNLDVIEHIVFHEKVSVEKCESLLRKATERRTIDAINRAIAVKKSRADGKP